MDLRFLEPSPFLIAEDAHAVGYRRQQTARDGDARPQGKSWDAEEVKKFSQMNRAERLSKSA